MVSLECNMLRDVLLVKTASYGLPNVVEFPVFRLLPEEFFKAFSMAVGPSSCDGELRRHSKAFAVNTWF